MGYTIAEKIIKIDKIVAKQLLTLLTIYKKYVIICLYGNENRTFGG